MTQTETIIVGRKTTNEEIFQKMLELAKPVNFNELASKLNKSNKKLRERDIIVFVIECVLKQAEYNGTLFCRANGCNYLYVDTHWHLVEDDKLQHFLSHFAYKMGVNWTDARYYGFQQMLMMQFATVAPLQSMKPEHACINLQNGTFEFKNGSGNLRQHKSVDGLTYTLPFGFDPLASCPVFDNYLKKVLPDAACRNIIAEYIGSIFIPSRQLKLEKALLLYGGGANGKSVLFDILNALLGTLNITSFSLQKLTDATGYYRAKFANMLLNYASEISKDLDTNLFKQLVSGEPVDARLPYGQPFIMQNYGKLMFNCNELPTYVEHTNGFFRRFIIVPFNVTIPETEQDKNLAQRIIDTELSGVFNWVLDGMQRLLEQKKFTESSLIAEQVKQYKIESDTVKLFLHEHSYKPSANNYELSSYLYQEYRKFCEEDGHRNPVNKKIFRQRLNNDGITITRHNEGGHKIYVERQHLVQEVLKVELIKEIF